MNYQSRWPLPALLAAGLSIGPSAVFGQVFQELYSLTGGADGSGSGGALIQANDGKFYGTTMWGPGYSNYGTVFSITPEGAFTTLAAFDGTNGACPMGALLQAGDGNFYGTTVYGGSGAGTLFKVTPEGTITRLFRFDGWDGASPVGDLVQGPDGKLYGVTRDGGPGGGTGTIFRMATNAEPWQLETLAVFYPWNPLGHRPSGGLLLANDGNFYGVAAGGGVCTGDGTIYRLSANGTVTTVASFCQGPGNAIWPRGKLLQASDENFYGGAGGSGIGTIFRLTPQGTLSTFSRIGEAYTGEDPLGGLIQANDGQIYGCTFHGGWNFDGGAVFRLNPDTAGCNQGTLEFCGNLTALFRFGETAPGWRPYAGLAQGRDGNLYGTTAFGGAFGGGNIFRIIMPGPLLSSAQAGHSIVLSWRTNYTGYVLQSSRDLESGEWTDCTNTVSVVGGQYFITNSLPGSARFFRLKKISQPASGKGNGH